MKRKSNLDHCDSDIHNLHYWEPRGITDKVGVEWAYYRCTQCRKWKREPITYVKDGRQ